MDKKDLPTAQRAWVREEVCLLVSEYFRTKALSKKEKEKSHEFVSKILRNRELLITGAPISDTFRNIAGISMQSDRIKTLDPDTKNRGMHGTKLQEEVVNEYLHNPTTIKAEAYDVICKYGM